MFLVESKITMFNSTSQDCHMVTQMSSSYFSACNCQFLNSIGIEALDSEIILSHVNITLSWFYDLTGVNAKGGKLEMDAVFITTVGYYITPMGEQNLPLLKLEGNQATIKNSRFSITLPQVGLNHTVFIIRQNASVLLESVLVTSYQVGNVSKI